MMQYSRSCEVTAFALSNSSTAGFNDDSLPESSNNMTTQIQYYKV